MDTEIYGSNNPSNNFDHFRRVFDRDGVNVLYEESYVFVKDPAFIKEEALYFVLDKKEEEKEIDEFFIEDEEDNLDEKIVT